MRALKNLVKYLQDCHTLSHVGKHIVTHGKTSFEKILFI